VKKLFRILLTAGLMLSLHAGSAEAAFALPDLGSDPTNPFVPALDDEGSFVFGFPVVVLPPGQYYFIDPEIAIGYDYVVTSGPNISSVLLPTITGDDGLYDLWSWDFLTSSYYDSGTDITAGTAYSFTDPGVSRFRIMGIDPAANLDPANPTAFVTGLTFVSAGTVTMTQTPVTTSVPEPSAMLLLGAGMVGLLWNRRRGIPA
jgi:hypothetical protein